MNRLTNRRRSDGTHLDRRHGICGLRNGSSWHCIAKWDTLSWFDHTRFCTTVRVSEQEKMMFESSSKNRKSWGGRQMIRQCIPDTRGNRWEWFGGCHGGFTCGNTYWQRWRRAECSRRYISRDERSKIGRLLKLQHPVSYRRDFKANSVANRKPMQIRENRCDVADHCQWSLSNAMSKRSFLIIIEQQVWKASICYLATKSGIALEITKCSNPRTAKLFQLTFAAKGGGLLQPPLDFGLPDRISLWNFSWV